MSEKRVHARISLDVTSFPPIKQHRLEEVRARVYETHFSSRAHLSVYSSAVPAEHASLL